MSIYTKTGVTLRLDTGTDLGSYSSPQVVFKSPAGPIGTWPATISGTKVVCILGDNMINTAGNWKFQSKVTKNGVNYLGAPVTIKVEASL